MKKEKERMNPTLSPESENVAQTDAPENNITPETNDATLPNDTRPVATDVSGMDAAVATIDNIPAETEDQIVAAQEKHKQRKLSRRKRRKHAKIFRILNLTSDKDIRYRGFISYRGLRILAWLFLILSQVGVLCSLGAKFDKGFAEQVGIWSTILPLFKDLMTPLFLLAAFATILNNSRKFSSMLLVYGFMATLFYAAFMLLHDRYMVGLVMQMMDVSREQAIDLLDNLVALVVKNGYFSFNVFIDLFLCTLFTFFIIYRPKKVFVGKWLIVFRLFAIIPCAYEIGSIVAKALSSIGTVVLPTYVYPLLTTKPPLTYIVFIALTFFIKNREKLYRRNGKTHEEYQAFLGSNLNSLQFSTFVTTQFILVAFIDVILFLTLGISLMGKFGGGTDGLVASLTAVQSWGFGECVTLLFVTPFVMLFSYTRTHKNTQMDLIINMVGIIFVVIVYLEGLYQGIIYEMDFFKGFLGGLGL